MEALSRPLSLTPDFLVDLAQADSAEIVRYWATRRTYFNRREPGELTGSLASLNATPKDQLRIAKLDADPSELVRAAGAKHGILLSLLSELVDVPQLVRLVRIRT